MKKSRYSEEQIIGFLRGADAGMPIKELCRKGGVVAKTYSACWEQPRCAEKRRILEQVIPKENGAGTEAVK